MAAPPRPLSVRSVAMPAEHGGWGLTLEPAVLAVLLAPSLAALALGLAALLAFLVRTPLRLVLIGRRRAGDGLSTPVSRERTHLATRVAVVELTGIGLALAVGAVLAVDPRWWLPTVVAAPLFAVALWFDMRSRSRHVVPEMAGSLAVAGVVAMGALAGGATPALALGAWLILAARILTSIPHVRAQVLHIHGRVAQAAPTVLGDLAALATALVAVLLEPTLALGAMAIVGLVVAQRVTLLRPPRPARVLGVRQMILGFAVVGAAALGAWVL